MQIMITLRFMQQVLFSVWLEIHLESVCSGREGKSESGGWGGGGGSSHSHKYRRPYAITVVADSILCIVAAICRGCRKFESCT